MEGRQLALARVAGFVHQVTGSILTVECADGSTSHRCICASESGNPWSWLFQAEEDGLLCPFEIVGDLVTWTCISPSPIARQAVLDWAAMRAER